jgi:uncharacterized protein DUF1735/F5/8 type C domain-containing protein
MKPTYKFFFIAAALVSSFFTLTSCNKPDMVTYSKEGNVYMPQAAGNAKMPLLLADTPQAIIFGAAYGGLKYPAGDIAVSFAVNGSLVTTYNSQHNTFYVLLPESSYTIPSLDAVIKSGSTTSTALSVNVTTKDLDRSLKYILPVSITSASAGYIDSSLNTTYFLIDTIQRLEVDVTAQATLSVSKDNDGGADANEGSKKLVDGDYNTKFLTGGFPQDFWVQLAFPSATIVGAYTITSGNDAPERDMKNWELVGSNDGTNWTVLDTRSDEVFPDRNFTKRYEFNNTTAYTQYRINVIANNGSDLIQVSEWRLINYP